MRWREGSYGEGLVSQQKLEIRRCDHDDKGIKHINLLYKSVKDVKQQASPSVNINATLHAQHKFYPQLQKWLLASTTTMKN